jgi:predicted nucleic acid-binding protein
MLTIYLDTCSLQRPLDDQRQIRVRLETEAILAVLEQVENGKLALLDSEILRYEIYRTPNLQRQQHITEILTLSHIIIKLNPAIEQLSYRLQNVGIKPLDALHLATAEQAKADYFCTCDDKLLKRAQKLDILETHALSPLQLLEALKL